MTFRARALLFIVACVVAVPASAQLPPLVKSALKTLQTDPDDWAYTQTSLEEGVKTVETFDPSRPAGQQWQLMSKDGRKPTAAELADYAKEKSAKKRGGRPEGGDVEGMIRPGTLRLVKETPAQAVYEFRLPLDEDDKNDKEARAMVDAMKGRLTIAKEGAWLQVFELETERPLKPVTGVRIDRIYTRMTYRAPAAGVPALLGEMRATIRGRAFLVKSLDQDSVVTLTDYRRVRPAR